MGDPTAATRAVNATRRRIRRGLDKPHPLGGDLLALPTVDAAIATVTLGANAGASSIANAVLIPANDNRLRLSGMQLTTRTGGGGTQLYQHVAQGALATGVSKACVDFLHYGSAFELYCQPQSAGYRIRVDGVSLSATVAAASTGGQNNHVLVDFGSAALRRIRIEMQRMFWFGIKVGPTDTVCPPTFPPGPSVVLVGDSFLDGANGVNAFDTWGPQLAALMGWRTVGYVSYGGTGYANPGTSPLYGAVTTRLPDIAYYAPDLVLLALGLNDAAYDPGTGLLTPAQIVALATPFLQSVKALSSVPTVVQLGPWTGSSTSVTSVTALNTALRTAAQVAGNGVDLYLDAVVGQWAKPDGTSGLAEGAWLSGSGRAGATTGSGNADLFRGSDGVHPTIAAHTYYAHRLAHAINGALPL